MPSRKKITNNQPKHIKNAVFSPHQVFDIFRKRKNRYLNYLQNISLRKSKIDTGEADKTMI